MVTVGPAEVEFTTRVPAQKHSAIPATAVVGRKKRQKLFRPLRTAALAADAGPVTGAAPAASRAISREIRDLKKSAYWYRRAYDNRVSHGVRSSESAHNYALDLYRAGKVSQAITWFEKARALKDGSAMTWLAKIEVERRGVKGHKKAIRLLKQALALEVHTEASELEHEEAAQALAKLTR